jgi:hypothetical protein
MPLKDIPFPGPKKALDSRGYNPRMFTIVVCADGEAPQLHCVADHRVLLQKLKSLATSQDAFVYVFAGPPIPFTQLPYRVLHLPSGPVQFYPTVDYNVPAALLAVMSTQADGYIGDAEFTRVHAALGGDAQDSHRELHSVVVDPPSGDDEQEPPITDTYDDPEPPPTPGDGIIVGD